MPAACRRCDHGPVAGLELTKVSIPQGRAEDVLGPLVKVIVTKCAEAVQRRATQLVPVDTGRLKSSIGYTVEATGKGPIAYVGSEVEYAAFVEQGTWRTSAQPYLVPALDAVRGRVA
jgi:HK97 gp10 family phage protein